MRNAKDILASFDKSLADKYRDAPAARRLCCKALRFRKFRSGLHSVVMLLSDRREEPRSLRLLLGVLAVLLRFFQEPRKSSQQEQLQYAEMMKQAQLDISKAAGDMVESVIEIANNEESL